MFSEEALAVLRLTLVPGLGYRSTEMLLTHFGSAVEAIRADRSGLEQIPQIGPTRSEAIWKGLQSVDLDAELQRMAKVETRILIQSDAEYPERLKQIPDPPHLLYVRGSIHASDSAAVAIVGSRDCSQYGQKLAESIARGLAEHGYTVISGLALGIDGCAHRGALLGQGRTLGILAGGLNQITPQSHRKLGEEVIQHGALISESPMMVAPKPEYFHSRNRIIAGIAQAVVVVEANSTSGTLITARHAAEQGRDVFVVPADVDRNTFSGSFELLRDGAKLIRGIEDLLQDLGGIDPTPIKRASRSPRSIAAVPIAQVNQPPAGLLPIQLRIWEALSDRLTIDQLIQGLDSSMPELAQQLMMLEMQGLIERLPGNLYKRK
jgi:DNA processing protein